MGKVMARITVRNNEDRGLVDHGVLEAVRSVEIEALVDTGATTLALPEDVVAALGLRRRGTRHAKMADGRLHPLAWVSGVDLEILGREMTCDALVLPAGTPALIGQIPLEALDLIVDPKSREVRVNPESPDAPVLDLYAMSRNGAAYADR